MQTIHRAIPTLPVGYEIGEEWAVIVPEATTNLITNPSFEADTLDGYAPGAPTEDNLIAAGTTRDVPDGTIYQPGPVLFLYGNLDLNTSGILLLEGTTSIEVTDLYQRRGSYGLQATWGVHREQELTSGTPYTFSADIYAPTAATYIISITDVATGRNVSHKKRFDGLGWGRLAVTMASPSTTGVHLLSIQRLDGGIFYTDGWQLEAKAYATTYTDGDMAGYSRQSAYTWAGGRHSSASSRTASTNSGGREVPLKELGLILTAVAGMGMAPLVTSAIGGYRDGSAYSSARYESRVFSLAGWVQGASYMRVAEQLGKLSEALRPRRTGLDEPIRLHVTPGGSCKPLLNGPLEMVASYTGGLEGATNSEYGQPVIANFASFFPFILAGGNDAEVLPSYDTVTANNILQLAPDGTVNTMAGGSNERVYDIILSSAGTYIASGPFTFMGGEAAGGIAEWNPVTEEWIPLGTGISSGTIYAILEDAEGNIFAGGNFTSIGGVTANSIAKWNRDAEEWEALGSGVNGIVYALAISRDGGVFVGGEFTTANGVSHNRIVKYMPDGTWIALGTGFDGAVRALKYSRWGELYIGGFFTTASGSAMLRITRWDGTTYHTLGSGFSTGSVFALEIGNRGELYAGGSFVLSGAGDVMRGIAVYEGEDWQALGSGLTEEATLLEPSVDALEIAPDGRLYVGGTFTHAGGIELPDQFAQWHNGIWLPIPLNLFGSAASPDVILLAPDGTLTIGFNTEGTAVVPAVSTVTNQGTAPSYPYRVEFSGPCRLLSLHNHTTGEGIFFDYLTLLDGETATLDLTPGRLSFKSSWRGNILNAILPGSSLASWHLAPGDNTITIGALDYSELSPPDVSMEWRTGYAAIEHATYLRRVPSTPSVASVEPSVFTIGTSLIGGTAIIG